jgi:hypothetical protein
MILPPVNGAMALYRRRSGGWRLPHVDGSHPRHGARMRTQVPGAIALFGFDEDFGPLVMGLAIKADSG